jgi:3-oxoadipate enol-lactonase
VLVSIVNQPGSHENTMSQMPSQTGMIEARGAIPLAEAMRRWRREARHGVVDTPHYRCRYFEWGQGQPLVFVHGLADRAASFIPLMAQLADTFRGIAYELPDGEYDGARLGSIRHADLAFDLIALLDALQVRQASAYGASLGGTIVLAALYREPRRFLRAALQSSFARRPLTWMERLVVSWARWWPGKLGDLPFWEKQQERVDGPAFAEVDPQLFAMKKAHAASLPIRAFAHRVLLVSSLDLRPMLASIRHPILLLTGDRDLVVNARATDELAHGLPHADRLEFADCGHYAQYTHASAVAEACRRFLLPPCGLPPC